MSLSQQQQNIENFLNQDYLNFNYLPQGIFLEDIDRGLRDFIKNWNISVLDENALNRAVPVVLTTQELWAERKNNWKSFRSEYGEEITRPFLALTRTNVEQGTLPLKRTIPKKMKFTYVKVPIFDGNLKNYIYYKVPQPVWVDVQYNLTLVTYYMSDVNTYYEAIIRDVFSDNQAYMHINGYHIPANLEGTTQTKEVDLSSENLYEISAQIMVHGRLVDPKQFEKVLGVNKFLLKMEVVQPQRRPWSQPAVLTPSSTVFALFENYNEIIFENGNQFIFEFTPGAPQPQLLSETSNIFEFEEGNFLVLETYN